MPNRIMRQTTVLGFAMRTRKQKIDYSLIISKKIIFRIQTNYFFVHTSLEYLRTMETEIQKKTESKKSAETKQKRKKIFNAQVNCTCKNKCAKLIDVVAQKDIFDK